MEINGSHRTRRARVVLVLVGGLVAALPMVLAPIAGAARDTCRAKNVTQGTTARSNLQRVIDAADRDDKITVKGVCEGTFQIRTSLSIVGRSTSQTPKPVLHAGGAESYVLGITRGVVRLANLKITGGGGGGIYNSGRLLLGAGVLVRGNTGVSGGGVYSERVLIMTSDVRVSGNDGTYGGGIYNFEGRVVLRGTASVAGNAASQIGGGILNSGGALILSGTSSVTGNTSEAGGGGIFGEGGTITLKDASSVIENTAGSIGGGIRNYAGSVLNVCDGTGAHQWTGDISPNTPDDPPLPTNVACG